MKFEGTQSSLPNVGRKELSRNNLVSKASDFGRFFGASAVFYYHMGLAAYRPFSEWGEYAVAFFIILSGIAYIGFTSVKPTDLTSYKRYLGGRLKTIFPIFIVINIAIFLASHFYPSALGRPFTFVEFLLSTTGLSQYFGYRYLSLVMWFVPFILQAYFLFPLIDSCLNRISNVLVIIMAFAISLTLIALVFWCWPSRAPHICRDWSVVFRLPEVCIGLIFGRWIFYNQSFKVGVAALVTFGLPSLVLALIGSFYFDYQAYILSLPWNGLIVTAIIVTASITTATILAQLRDKGFIRLLGAASFPFYLAHGIAIGFISHRFGNNPLVWTSYYMLCWFAAIVFTIVFQTTCKVMKAK